MTITIGDYKIQNFGNPYMIAEVGANHNGNVDLAKKMALEAKKIGCHCVKFQSWTKETIFSAKSYRDNFFLKDDYRQRKDYTLEKIVEEFSLSENDLLEISQYCHEIDIDITSSVFSEKELHFLIHEMKAPFVKVASMDVTNLPFLKRIAEEDIPIVMSSGLSELYEFDRAIRVIENAGNKKIIILHCVSNYPPRDENVNLNNMDTLRMMYPEYPVGFSDHTIGTSIPLAAVAKGACIIEKHFTLDKEMFGWDHKISADLSELDIIVKESKRIYAALGSNRRKLNDEDITRQKAFRRSIVTKRDMDKGEIIGEKDVDYKRPGTGISPSEVKYVFGKRLNKSIKKDELIYWDDLR